MASKVMPGAQQMPSGPLGPNSTQKMIGGTHNVSVGIDPQNATQSYTPIPGDSMPSGTPMQGGSGGGSGDPYTPGN